METLDACVFVWNRFWCNVMSLNVALNLIAIVFMYMYTCHASSCFNLCIYIFVHIFSRKHLTWKLNKHLIVYLMKTMLCFRLFFVCFVFFF